MDEVVPPPIEEYVLLPHESLPDGMARALRSQFEVAIVALGDAANGDDVGIHTARKSMKRLRAMLRMVRDGISDDIYRRENVLLRDLGRSIAPARDSFVLIQTLDIVLEGSDSTPYGSLRQQLQQDHNALMHELMGEESFLPDIATELAAASDRVGLAAAHLLPDVPVRPLPAIVVKGTGRTYGRARKGCDQSMAEPGDGPLHGWRKRVKYLRHQLESLGLLIPARFVHMTLELDELGELLGNHHDIEVLIDTAQRMTSHEVEGLVDRGRELQERLRRRALSFTYASAAFKPTKKDFRQDLGQT